LTKRTNKTVHTQSRDRTVSWLKRLKPFCKLNLHISLLVIKVNITKLHRTV